MQLKHLFSSRRARLVLTAIVALSPLAYLGSVYFLVRNDPNTRLGLELSRNGLLRVAETNAASLGLDVSNWSRGLESKVSNDRHYYFRLHQTPEVEQIKAFVPPISFRTVFLSPDGREKVCAANA
jgi:hypothetical protein